jgi:hypothetical protein
MSLKRMERLRPWRSDVVNVINARLNGLFCSIQNKTFLPLTHRDMGNVFKAYGTLKTMEVRYRR